MTPIRYAPILLILVAACSKTPASTTSPMPPSDAQQTRAEAESQQRRGNSESVHVLGIPPGHLPRTGQCRVWVPGTPPGQQAKSRSCNGIAETAPAGSWIVYRPGSSRDVHVHVVDRNRALSLVRHYNAEGGWVRDEQAHDHRHDDDDGNNGRGRGRRRP